MRAYLQCFVSSGQSGGYARTLNSPGFETPPDDDVVGLAAQCREIFNDAGKAPGSQAVFGVPFAWPDLHEYIGLDDDSNRNLTRRMLTLLESVAVTGDAREESWHAILKRYLRHA